MDNQIYLVSCVSQKQSKPAKAKDLYVSQWFKKAKLYVEKNQAEWFILSAKYCLVNPESVIDPYEKTLNTMSKPERLAWAQKTSAQIRISIPTGSELIFLGGDRYRENLIKILKGQYKFSVPMEGLGIGRQLEWLKNHT